MQGADGADGESLTWKGSYSLTGPYKKNEIYIFEETAEIAALPFPPQSTYFGNIYICVGDHDSFQWPYQSPNWQLFTPKADNGQDGADGKSFQWRGIYDSETTYNLNDVVRIDVNSLPVSEYDSAILYDKALFIAKADPATLASSQPWFEDGTGLTGWELFIPKPDGFQWKGNFESDKSYMKNDIVKINHMTLSAAVAVDSEPFSGNLYIVKNSNGVPAGTYPWATPSEDWELFLESSSGGTNSSTPEVIHIQNPSYYSTNDTGGTHAIGSNDNTPKFEMWYTHTNNKVSLKGRFNFGQATSFSSPASINLNPGYITTFSIGSQFPDGNSLPFIDYKMTAPNAGYTYLGKAYYLKWDMGVEAWVQKDFTCMVGTTSLDIMNNTSQTITIEGDFYFEVEYDTQT